MRAEELYELQDAGYLRVDLRDDLWVSLMSTDGVNFGGTLWKRSASDGFDYSEGCTAGYPVFCFGMTSDEAARQVALYIAMESGADALL